VPLNEKIQDRKLIKNTVYRN